MEQFVQKRGVLFLILLVLFTINVCALVSEEPNPDIWVIFTDQGRVNITSAVIFNSTNGELNVEMIDEGVGESGIYNEEDDTHLFHFKPSSPNEFLQNGNYVFYINATDANGNVASQQVAFTILVPELHISILFPTFGVANSTTYNLTIQTSRDTNLTNSSHCRYNLNSDRTYANMDKRLFLPESYDSYNSTHKTANEISGDYNIYIRCRDVYYNDYLQIYEIKSDTTAPIISSVSVSPNPIVEEVDENPKLEMNIQTTMYAYTDDEVICKYHNTSIPDFNQMAYNFSGFDPITDASYKTESEALVMHLRDDSTYTKFIVCKNKAELQSIVSTTSFYSWLDAPLNLTAIHSPNGSASTRRDFLLNFSTNKHTQCLYGAEEDQAIIPVDGSYSKNHYRIISGIPRDGVYNYSINCTYFDQVVEFEVNFISDRTPPSTPYVNDSNPQLYDNPQYSYYTDRIYLKWNSSDELSGIDRYEIQILEMVGSTCGSGPIVRDWFNYNPEAEADELESDWFTNFDQIYDDQDGDEDDDPELIDGKKYCFQVKAIDGAGQESNIAKSDGVTIDVSRRPRESVAPSGWLNVTNLYNSAEVKIGCLDIGNRPSGCNKNNYSYGIAENQANCNNQEYKYTGPFNINETKIVCWRISDYAGNAASGAEKVEVTITIPGECQDKIKGENETDIDCGGSCPGCGNGRACMVDEDCSSAFCRDKVCARPDCSDEYLNQDESDIDCGGSCDKCELEKKCNNHNDCLSGSCQENLCVPSTCDDSLKNGDESDVDCGGACAKCQNLLSCNENSDCISGFCDANICKNQNDQSIIIPEEEKSMWPWILAFLLILIIGGGVAYYFLIMKKKPVAVAPVTSMPVMQQQVQARKQQTKPKVDYKKLLAARKKKKLADMAKKLADDKRLKKERERLGMFDEFGEGELDEDGQPKVVSKIPFSKKQATKKYTVFDKLADVLGDKKSFDKLSKLSGTRGGSFDELDNVVNEKTFDKLSKYIDKPEKIKKTDVFKKLKSFVESGEITESDLNELSGTSDVFDQLPKIKKKGKK